MSERHGRPALPRKFRERVFRNSSISKEVESRPHSAEGQCSRRGLLSTDWSFSRPPSTGPNPIHACTHRQERQHVLLPFLVSSFTTKRASECVRTVGGLHFCRLRSPNCSHGLSKRHHSRAKIRRKALVRVLRARVRVLGSRVLRGGLQKCQPSESPLPRVKRSPASH